MTGGVYKIVVEGVGTYYGESANIQRRWTRHRMLLRDGRHTNFRLKAAWKAFGPKAFTFTVLMQSIELTQSVALRRMIEKAMIESDPLCLNIRDSKGINVNVQSLPRRAIYANRIVRITRIKRSAIVRITNEEGLLLGVESVDGKFRMGKFYSDEYCQIRRLK